MKGLFCAVAAGLLVAVASAETGSFCYGDVNMKCSSSAGL